MVGAVELTGDDAELIFISNDAQLLRFPAAAVRPQGRSGGGMAGIRLGVGASVVFFGAVPRTPRPTPSWSRSPAPPARCPAPTRARSKVTWLAEYPGKGRATGGVRCHRFLKGEDVLMLAWAGPEPAWAAAPSGAPVDLPEPDRRRDGSGVPAAQPIAAVSSPRVA